MFKFPLVLYTIIKFVRIFTIKRILKNAGKNYCVLNVEYKKGVIISCCVVIIISTIINLVFYRNWVAFTICIIIIIISLSDIIIKKIHGNVIGIYENGIIDNNYELNMWKNIHSYKIDNKNIIGYYKNGELYEFIDNENINEIKKILIKNNVRERNE